MKNKQECKDCNESLNDCTCIEDTIDMKETLEEAKFRIYKDHWNVEHTQWIKSNFLNGFEAGAKWQQERSYSEEEVINLLYIRSMCQEHYESDAEIREWFNKFKKK